MTWRASSKVLLSLSILAFWFFELSLHRYSSNFREIEAAFVLVQSLALSCFLVWCVTFIFLSRRTHDWLLVIFLSFAAIWFFSATHSSSDVLALVFGIALGKGTQVVLSGENSKSEFRSFVIGLCVLLIFSSWWRLDMADNYYHGSRWMGLWDNPNTYGMLMGAGGLLAIGLLVANAKMEDGRWKIAGISSRRLLQGLLWTAIFMLGVGLVMSYSRGAWLATGIGLTYLAWCYGKLKWKYMALGAGLLAVGVLLFWGRTPDAAPWYLKRADLGRPSAQHRATAWRAGLEMMRDHPLGVGWNNAVSLYDKQYSPPEGGAAAITTNDYMMIGTELGIPALLCFVAYVGLCYRKSPRIQELEVRSQELEAGSQNPEFRIQNESESLRAACLSGALVFVVAFWFDGGLFKLPTAAMFWVLLELGSARDNSHHAAQVRQQPVSDRKLA